MRFTTRQGKSYQLAYSTPQEQDVVKRKFYAIAKREGGVRSSYWGSGRSLQYQPSQVTTRAERIALQTAPRGVGLEITGARAKAQRYQQATYGVSPAQKLARERVVTGLSPTVKEKFFEKATPTERAELIRDTDISRVQYGTRGTVAFRKKDEVVIDPSVRRLKEERKITKKKIDEVFRTTYGRTDVGKTIVPKEERTRVQMLGQKVLGKTDRFFSSVPPKISKFIQEPIDKYFKGKLGTETIGVYYSKPETFKDVFRPGKTLLGIHLISDIEKDFFKRQKLIEDVRLEKIKGKTRIGTTTYGEIADVGTYAIPYVGAVRFYGTDIPALTEKAIYGEKFTTFEKGIVAVGGAYFGAKGYSRLLKGFRTPIKEPYVKFKEGEVKFKKTEVRLTELRDVKFKGLETLGITRRGILITPKRAKSPALIRRTDQLKLESLTLLTKAKPTKPIQRLLGKEELGLVKLKPTKKGIEFQTAEVLKQRFHRDVWRATELTILSPKSPKHFAKLETRLYAKGGRELKRFDQFLTTSEYKQIFKQPKFDVYKPMLVREMKGVQPVAKLDRSIISDKFLMGSEIRGDLYKEIFYKFGLEGRKIKPTKTDIALLQVKAETLTKLETRLKRPYFEYEAEFKGYFPLGRISPKTSKEPQLLFKELGTELNILKQKVGGVKTDFGEMPITKLGTKELKLDVIPGTFKYQTPEILTTFKPVKHKLSVIKAEKLLSRGYVTEKAQPQLFVKETQDIKLAIRGIIGRKPKPLKDILKLGKAGELRPQELKQLTIPKVKIQITDPSIFGKDISKLTGKGAGVISQKNLLKQFMQPATKLKLETISLTKLLTDTKSKTLLKTKIDTKALLKTQVKTQAKTKIKTKLKTKLKTQLDITTKLSTLLKTPITTTPTIRTPHIKIIKPPKLILPPVWDFGVKKKKLKKELKRKGKQDLFYIPDFTARALDISVKLPKSALPKLPKIGMTGLEIRPLINIKGGF